MRAASRRSGGLDVARLRIVSQGLATPRFATPAEVVRWLGAVQAQDYLASLWAVGLRTSNATEAGVEAALTDRSIVRTWPMRGTLHFVPAEDARWMLALLTPRVVALSAGRYRQLELDQGVFTRAEKLLAGALEGGRRLTRPAVYRILEQGGIAVAAGSRGLHILGHLAQRQVLCFGAREGKQPTFVLLDEWVPDSRRLVREEALAELALRYFQGHGPATVHDFAWWSGLRVAEAKEAVGLVGTQLTQEMVEDRPLLFSGHDRTQPQDAQPAHLLPFYDEFTVAYQDRSDVLVAEHAKKVGRGGILNPTVVIDGRVLGTWKRELIKDGVLVKLAPFAPFGRKQRGLVERAVERYGRFLGRTPTLV